MILWILTGWPPDSPRLDKWGSIVGTSHSQRRSRKDGSCPPTRGWSSTGTPMPTSTLWRLCHTKRNGMAFLTQNIGINFTFHSTIPTSMSVQRLGFCMPLCHSATLAPDMRHGDADSMPMVPTDSRQSRCHHDSDCNARAFDFALWPSWQQGSRRKYNFYFPSLIRQIRSIYCDIWGSKGKAQSMTFSLSLCAMKKQFISTTYEEKLN